MGKVIDITEKLGFTEKPALVIRGKNIPVNDDALTILKLLGKIGDDGTLSPSQISEIADNIFTEEGKKVLAKLHLNMADFSTVVEEALNLVMGDEDADPNPEEKATMTSSMTGT